MNRTLTEQKVLRKLGIQDFRHMTKEKVTGFVSMLPRMDPEVAKKALEQFPDFTKTAIAITADLINAALNLVGAERILLCLPRVSRGSHYTEPIADKSLFTFVVILRRINMFFLWSKI